MARLLRAALLLALLAPHVAWKPPNDPVVFSSTLSHSRLPRHAHLSIRHLHVLGWHLELQENRAIRSPYYNECQFYKGRVLYEESSTVTVTECAGQLYGLLQVDGEDYVVQPTKPEGSHVLRRRDVRVSEQPVSYNLTDDTVDDLDIDFEEERPSPVPFVRRRSGDKFDNEYFRGVQTVTRPVAGIGGLWLELAIVADHTILKFHGRDRVEHYILAIMNIVSAIFNDRSLDSNMTLVINKLFLYEEKDWVIKNGNVQRSLESVNKWNYKHLMKLPPGSTGWDATVWLTRARLGGPSGYAPVGGVCTRTRSAAIGRDEGLTSAFVLAHEIAHLLGVKHDGPGHCEADSSRGSVMASTVLATLHNYAWSTCSRKQFHEKAEKLWCLHERSRDEGVVLGGSKALSNYVFTMDEQCRTEFGEGFSVCKSVNLSSPCAGLYCAHRSLPAVCRSKRAPPLEGTPCGHNRWCVDRVCEVMPGRVAEHRADVQPQWGEWGEWSACDAHCGYGLRTRSRRCQYRGSISETACEGAGSQVATCWSGAPCSSARDARADSCYRRARTLIPHLPQEESKSCELWCVRYDGGEPTNFGHLPDGVACNYTSPYDLCYQGTCVRGQCNSTDPGCNWCADGYCSNHTQIQQRQLSKSWTRLTVVPREANQISVHISTPVLLNIAIREMKLDRQTVELFKHSRRFELDNPQDNYLKYDHNVPQNLQIIEVDSNVIDIKEGERYGWEGQVVAAGSLIHWKQTDTDVSITTSSQLQNDLMIMAIANHFIGEEVVMLEISVNYSIAADRARPMEYRWSVERGPCSVSCGGGMRKVRSRCGRNHHCGPTTYETCNTHSCQFTWSVGEWEECSATCGDKGVQERQLYCVPDSISIRKHELVKRSVSPALCPLKRPETQQRCNRLPCPVYWKELPWTQCSATCGRGLSYRPLVCPGGDDLLCGPKPRERRRRCRLRRCPSRRPVCPHKDGTQYCELFTHEQLERNCLLPPFRSYCCNTCRSVHTVNGVP